MWRVVPFAFAVLWSAQAQSEPVAGVASVIDGDTLEIHGQRVRLFGIDAPESGQPCETAQGERWRCGRDAAIALADLIGRAPIQCDPQDIDRYGRVVAVCYQGNLDIGAEMVRAGWAVAYRRYSRAYVRDEDAARLAGRGLWAGVFHMPWDWRRSQE
ncbi:MAG: thermonuclease family protein [Burkholderiaceae bacterium]|nr:thermonuclease family protein [Burkholderiaceae bacterium]